MSAIYPQTRDSKIIEMRANGYTIKTIAECLGLSKYTIKHDIIRLNRPVKGKPKKEKIVNPHKENKKTIIEVYPDIKDRIGSAVQDGKTLKTLANELELSLSGIIKYAHRFGINGRSRFCERDKKIIEYRKKKLTYPQIAKLMSTSTGIVCAVCKNAGLGKDFYNPRVVPKAPKGLQTEEKVREIIEQRHLNLKYVGNYSGTNGKATVMCVKCGRTFTLSYVHLRSNNTVKCPYCVADKRKENELTTRQTKERLRRQEELQRAAQILSRYFRVECVECGQTFLTKNKRKYYFCCEECKKRFANRKRDHRISQKQIVDKDITLRKLYERDNGVCYLCGCRCDWSDKYTKNNAVIVGATYPTIEHVIPICNGGLHSWENIKLACHKCNSQKGKKEIKTQ